MSSPQVVLGMTDMQHGIVPYLIAPEDWRPDDPNPFTDDGSYGRHWSAFCLLERNDDQFVTGAGTNGLFAARFGRRVQHLDERLADFLHYESAQRRHAIVSLPQVSDVAGHVSRVLSDTPPSHVVRRSDPRVVVHATALVAWQAIRAEGSLRAASQLASIGGRAPAGQRGWPSELASYLEREPPEYSEYVMFAPMDSTAPELVLASHQSGRFVLSERAVYEPGIRLYLDAHRIIRDGLATRDGLHTLKVLEHLPLGPYLLAAIGVWDADPSGEVTQWTPKEFVERANAVYVSGTSPLCLQA